MKIRLKQTCQACPEQYEAFLGDEQVGYIRVRHGIVRADSPDAGGRTIYCQTIKGDGMFASEEEQKHHLTKICQLLLVSHPKEDEVYEID